jgi:hypothetical protein
MPKDRRAGTVVYNEAKALLSHPVDTGGWLTSLDRSDIDGQVADRRVPRA